MAAFQPRPVGSAGQGIKKVFAASLTDIATFDKDGLGAIRFEGDKIYKYIKYNNGTVNTEGLAGHFVTYFGVAGHDNSEVTFDHSDGTVGAGVLVAALQDGNFGYIQIQGPNTLLLALTAGADGDKLTIVGAGDGTLDVSALVSDQHAAVAIDQANKKVLLTCPF